MSRLFKLLCVFAHPDDESLGTGSTLAKYAAEGVGTYLVVATRGERGWQGDPAANPGLQRLGALRTDELRGAARVLGLQEVHFLDYVDGDLDQAEPARAIAQIVGHVRRIQPQVVITFGPDGSYGHPDHIAISQFTTAALVAAADSSYPSPHAPHRVTKLYYMVEPQETVELYEQLFGGLTMEIDTVTRRAVPWPEWAITTEIDADAYWPTAWQAIQCHKSQLVSLGAVESLLEPYHRPLIGLRHFYRAFSLVNGGRAREHDLFEGVS